MSFFLELMRCEWTGNIREIENVAERTIFSESALSQLLKSSEASPETLNKKLEAAAAERLFEILAEHDFKQRNVAAALDMSPSTLIKLMQRFGLPRPTDLSAELIQEAIARANGDLDLAANALNVSPQGLKKFLSTKSK